MSKEHFIVGYTHLIGVLLMWSNMWQNQKHFQLKVGVSTMRDGFQVKKNFPSALQKYLFLC